ncbi:MAG TPA: Ig-like domain-containing protein, partial [Thermoanaerobaculia bacterium]|nr:Ig-like domain-containing protein [Thermoanaerobaculia bacterium]
MSPIESTPTPDDTTPRDGTPAAGNIGAAPQIRFLVRPTSPSGASARRRRSFAFPPAQPLGITAAFRHTILATLAILTTIAQPALAQIPPEVIHSEDFQSYPTQASPAGWVDTAVGQPGPAAEGIFKTWPDPTQGNRGTNIVYGTKQASGKPEGKTPRIGTFTTLTTKSFDGRGRFELRGRLIRTAADARAGITFFSSYPETDRYYLLGLWSQPGSSKLTMQLFGFRGRAEDGTPLGSFEEESIIDSNVTPEPGKWYRFLIQSDVIGETTHIRARFWLDGEAEPETFSIDAADSSPSRLTAGRIGVWAAVRGESYADELFAKSPVDFTAPVIEFFEGESPLPTGKKFNRNVAPLIRVTDDIDASPARTIELDGEPFTEGSTVESEGLHTIRVRAIDSAGNASDGQVTFLIDKTPPVVRIVVAGAPLTTGAVFDRDITPFVEVEDLTSTTIVATLGGEPYDIAHAADPGTPITAEALHTLLVTVTDELGWTTTAGPVSFAVDKTAPVIRILEGGSPFGAGSYNRDLTLVIEVDDLTPQSAAFTLNGAPFVSGTPITAEQKHTFAGEARDRAGHVTTLDPIIFFIDKTKPLVEIFDGAKRLLDDSYVDHDVLPEVRISDESETTTTAALNGEPYDLATPITGEREHHLEVRVVDTVGWIVDLDVHFTIDKTPPSLALEVGGAPLVSGRIFSADLAVEAVSSDVNPEPLEALLNGTPYALGSAIEDERNHTIVVTAKDKAGNTTTAGPIAFVLDKSAPEVRLLLENGSPFPDGAHFNRDLQPQLEVADLTATTVVATITSNGNEQPWTPGTPITAEGSYTIAATVTDAAGHETVITPAGFVIDKTPPAITITSHADSAAIATPLIALRGGSDDAKTVLLNGVAATIDAATKTFISKDLNLLEGANRFDLLATDRAGNQTAKTLTLILDTRAPELAIAAPLANACSNSGSIALSGTVSDPRLDRVTVSIGAPGGAPEASVTATVAGSAWTATLPTGAEGPKSIVVEAADSVGHLARQQIAIRIDRTAPQIEVTEGGAPFAANRAVGRAIALFVRVTDADPSVAMQARLDGQPYTPGTQISAEGAHTLVVEAADCAGNAAAPLTLPFRIDLTAPALHAIDPANGSTIRTAVSSISGTTDDDVATVAISGGPQTTPAANGTFTLSGITLAEGLNRFRIELTDRAGNRTEVPYEVRLKSQPPSLEILESGTPIPPDAIFNREIRPEVRTGEPGVTPAVTLNGGPFNSGSPVTADGAYTLAATATDSVGNTASSSVAFTIDRTPPVVTITSPASGPAEVAAIDVAGTAGDAIEVTVNGRLATLSGGNFSVTALPLDEGENAIVAAGRDAAGNFGRDEVVVTREAAGPGIILTHPAGGLLTNRPFTRVAGRVLTAAKAAGVSVERRTASGESVESTLALDPAGAFVLDALPLVEGENVITVSTIPSPLVSGPSSLSITVTADLTPPTLAILEAALPLAEGARFPERAILSIDASDTRLSPLASRLFVDGSEVTTPHTVSSAGGHTAIALARDDAGNETRLERNFYIGLAGTATAGCDLREIDPRDG